MDKNSEKKTGAVLVQGAGIAGIQAALDLANSGFKVYLVERSAAIGGMMSRLDKTFPTGDCATCIVSPKLVECARNLNIQILTLSELVDLKGEPGYFKATVKSFPRYIDSEKCTACGQCTEVCPVSISNKFDGNLGDRKAIAKYYAQATPNVFQIMKNGHSPCKVNCPANINVQGYIQLIKKKEYIKAVNLIRERNPLSGICGRICNHPCESNCTRRNLDQAVAIRLLKRFASDKEIEMVKSGKLTLPEEKTIPAGAKKIAVIGAGPSGLALADDLAGRGFKVTVYESSSAAGGMLRWGIPEYRLPKDILDYEIELIRRKGVTFVYNCRVGKDITIEKLREENDAVYIGIGFQSSRKLGVPGEEKADVLPGVDFLTRAKNQQNRPQMKEHVLVVGGGNVAVDVARTALRIGAKKVDMICLEQRDEMPALPEEVKATLEEGITIHNGWGPNQVLGNGKVDGIELKKCTRVYDENKRFSPIYDDKVLTTIPGDQIIVAIGQSMDRDLVASAQFELERGIFKVDPKTFETSIKGIFAGGDAVSGAATVIQGVAAGKKAAESIARFLAGEDMRINRFESTVKPLPEEFLPILKGREKKQRSIETSLTVPDRVDNFKEIDLGLTEEQALAEAERCLNCALCSECRECVGACENLAVNHNMTEKTVDLEVGSVIITPGFDEFDAEKKGEYGFKRYPNVVTSVQFERMLSASGPFSGQVLRRTDSREAMRIAWIQCVGSRDVKCGNEYCSSVCCMVSTKQAMVASDHIHGLSASIFYMDIRAHGKDFDEYYERAKNQGNINYIKSIPSRVMQVPGTKDLRLQYLVGDKFEEQDFDLVVLSVGMEPSKSAEETAKKLGIKLNEWEFCATSRLSPLETSRPGVYVAGSFQEPKDIPETVTQASAAASMAMEWLAESRNSLVTKKTYPTEHDITDEEPRIGVFICHCGKNIASVVDVAKVAEEIGKEPGVALASHTMYTCSSTTLSEIKEAIKKYRLNRFVVASCTPRTHEPIFRETLRESGLNQYLFELANIRDQCSWVHSAEPEKATQKAIQLVKMSVARARLLMPLKGTSYAVDQTGVVIGGGVSGMTAALALADQGFKTHLVEKSDKLGGNFLNLRYTLEHEDIGTFLQNLIKQTKGHPNIHLHMQTDVVNVDGFAGQFELTLKHSGQEKRVKAGAIIVATGAVAADTSEFLRGKSTKVISQSELEEQLNSRTFEVKNKNIVMIQCAGSRNEERRYCSRLCCSMAVKNALEIKRQDSNANVFVLYRDIRTYGFREKYYQEARKAGVLFIRYEPEKQPTVSESGPTLKVVLESPDLPEPIEIEADNVILSTGVDPNKNNRTLANMIKVPLNGNGFFVEAHLKLRPVDFATEGIFLCGLAHSPKMVDENISQAKATAARAATILSKTQLELDAQVSRVNPDKCISCMTCVHVCPFNAPRVNVDRKAEINPANCMGCGICVAECPAQAIELNHFTRGQFRTMLDDLFKNLPKTENKENLEKVAASK
jgi:heterodisulfide reductase subunit A-like polyferredoxin